VSKQIKAASFAILILCATAGYGAEIKKYAGEFMASGVGGRALGMGGAYVAVTGDVTFGYWNPAGLSTLRYPELGFMHARRFGGVVNYDYLGGALPVSRRETIGINLVRLAVDDIPITALPRPDLPLDAVYTNESGETLNNRPYEVRSVSDAEYALYLSYARMQMGRFAWGASAKLVHKGVGDNSAWGAGFDIGMIWLPWRSLRVGANLQDFTTTLLAWDTGERELVSPTLKAGVAYPFIIRALKSRLLLAADADLRMEGRKIAAQSHLGPLSADYHLGAEWVLRNIVALRAGSDMGYFSAGAGLRLPRLDLDYAFLKHDQLDNSHRISLRVRIEERKARK
jgi:hypothetical protein